MYILLSGDHPFQGKNDTETFNKIKTGLVDMTGDEWEIVSPEAKTLVLRFLEKDPSERITIEEALVYPWIAEKDITCSMEPNAMVASKIEENFSGKKRLRKGINSVMFSNRLKKLSLVVANSKLHSPTTSSSEKRTKSKR